MKVEWRSSFGWPAHPSSGRAPCRNGMVAHYDGSNLGLADKPHSACRAYWQNTRSFHMGPSRGWLDIGYSFGVCLSLDNSEVLTRMGWKMLADVTGSDQVASWSPDSETITFDAPVSYTPAHEAEVIKVHHWEMTRDHRMFVKDYRRPDITWKERPAGEIKRNSIIPGQGRYAAPGMMIEDDVLRLLVWAQADGHYVMRNRGIVSLTFHLKKERKIERMLSLLGRLGLSHTVTSCHDGAHTKIRIYGAEWLRDNVYARMPDKTWTWDFLDLDEHQVGIILDEIPHVDGDAGGSCMYAGGRYYSSMEINTDVISALCVLHGRKASVVTHGDCREIQVSRSTAQQHWVWSPAARLDNSVRRTMVGCVETVNGTLIVRQNGRIAIVGNCPHGIVFEGRGFGYVQAAQPGGNTTWTSCTFMTGDAERPTKAQLNAWRELRAWLRGKGVGAAVLGHKDFISTSCPGSALYKMVKDGTLTGAATREDDDMPDYVSVGLTDRKIDMPPGEWVTVWWDHEYGDAQHHHASEGGPSFVEGPARYSMNASVRIEGLTPGTELQARMIERRDSDGKTENGPIAEYLASGGATFIHYALGSASVSDGSRVRFQVVHYGTETAKIVSGDAKALAWPL